MGGNNSNEKKTISANQSSAHLQDKNFEPLFNISNEQKCIYGNVKQCHHTKVLCYVMDQYNKYDLPQLDASHIQLLLDRFLHALNCHNDNDDFEYIVSKGGVCDITKCDKYRRFPDHQDRVNVSILDKIHCFYYHSFNIGYRLSHKERKELYAYTTQLDFNDDNLLQNHILQPMIQILAKKKKNATNISHFNQRFKRFTAINSFHFGNTFRYEDSNLFCLHDSNLIKPKYASLKEEITQNPIAILTSNQFEWEYKKAKMYYGSRMNKSYLPLHNLTIKDIKRYHNYINIQLEHILAVMIYCNYNTLQYEFSKTYRENMESHDNFYHLGKSLATACQKFGTLIQDGNVTAFHCGIGEKLLAINSGYSDREYGILSAGPLSTSSSFEVAVNFTNHNKGLILTFGQFENSMRDTEISKLFMDSGAKYYSCQWLSDYPAESEYLFIYNTTKSQKLLLTNIIDASTGTEYYKMISAFEYINTMFSGVKLGAIKTQFDKSISKIIAQIVYCQLSQSMSEFQDKLYSKFASYGEAMIHQTFDKIQFVRVDYRLRIICEEVYDLFFDLQQNKIRWDLLFVAFPKHLSIELENMPLNHNIVSDTIEYFRTHEYNRELQTITISASQHAYSVTKQFESIQRNCVWWWSEYGQLRGDMHMTIPCTTKGVAISGDGKGRLRIEAIDSDIVLPQGYEMILFANVSCSSQHNIYNFLHKHY